MVAHGLWQAAASLRDRRTSKIHPDLLALLFYQLFGRRQLLAGYFQIVISVTEFNYELGEGNQMFDLEAQGAPPAAAHFFEFRPLLVGHANIESDILFGHP